MVGGFCYRYQNFVVQRRERTAHRWLPLVCLSHGVRACMAVPCRFSFFFFFSLWSKKKKKKASLQVPTQTPGIARHTADKQTTNYRSPTSHFIQHLGYFPRIAARTSPFGKGYANIRKKKKKSKILCKKQKMQKSLKRSKRERNREKKIMNKKKTISFSAQSICFARM